MNNLTRLILLLWLTLAVPVKAEQEDSLAAEPDLRIFTAWEETPAAAHTLVYALQLQDPDSFYRAAMALSLEVPGAVQPALLASDTQPSPLALYWRAVVALSLQDDVTGLAAYEDCMQILTRIDQAIAVGVTVTQWQELHFLAARAGQRLGRSDLPAAASLGGYVLGQHYLAYNDAVQHYKAQQGLSAMLALKTLVEMDAAAQDAELAALHQRLLLTLGQWQLADGRFSEGVDTLQQVSKDAPERDEALLYVGWGLSRKRDWAQATGIWQWLAQQPDSPFALEAAQALAFAYVQQGAEQQALAQYQQLIAQWAQRQSHLEALAQRLQGTHATAFWRALLATSSSASWPPQLQPLLFALWQQQPQSIQTLNLLPLLQPPLAQQHAQLRALAERTRSPAQRQRLQQQQAHIHALQQQVDTLMQRAAEALTDSALTAIAAAKHEAQQQQARAQLAIWQLQDRWRGAYE